MCVRLGPGWESLDWDWSGERRAPLSRGWGSGRPASEPAGAGSLPALLALAVVAGAGVARGSWWQPGAARLPGPSSGVNTWSFIHGMVRKGELACLVLGIPDLGMESSASTPGG